MCRMNLIQRALYTPYLGASFNTLSYINNSHTFSVDDSEVQRFDENFQISSLRTKNQITSSNHFIKRISIMWDILNDSKNDLDTYYKKILLYDDA